MSGEPDHCHEDPCIDLHLCDEASIALQLADEVVRVIELGEQGPSGRDGDDGFLVYPAAMPLSALRAVWMTVDGLRYASANDPDSCDAVLGITANASAENSPASVRHFGRIADASWNWTQEAPVFLGLDGALTQTPDNALPLVKLGIAIDAQTLLVRIQTAFF